jgi:hydrogenase maturation factor
MSQGAMLLAAEDGNALVRALEREGIPAAVVGKATDSNDRILLCDGERRFLETTQTDELLRVEAR